MGAFPLLVSSVPFFRPHDKFLLFQPTLSTRLSRVMTESTPSPLPLLEVGQLHVALDVAIMS